MKLSFDAGWSAADSVAPTIPVPPDSNVDPRRVHFPKYCACCNWPTTYAEWMRNKSRRMWPGLDLEIAECGNACGNTLSVDLGGE